MNHYFKQAKISQYCNIFTQTLFLSNLIDYESKNTKI